MGARGDRLEPERAAVPHRRGGAPPRDLHRDLAPLRRDVLPVDVEQEPPCDRDLPRDPEPLDRSSPLPRRDGPLHLVDAVVEGQVGVADRDPVGEVRLQARDEELAVAVRAPHVLSLEEDLDPGRLLEPDEGVAALDGPRRVEVAVEEDEGGRELARGVRAARAGPGLDLAVEHLGPREPVLPPQLPLRHRAVAVARHEPVPDPGAGRERARQGRLAVLRGAARAGPALDLGGGATREREREREEDLGRRRREVLEACAASEAETYQPGGSA